MRFTRLHLVILLLGIVAVGSGVFIWMLDMQQEFVSDDSDRIHLKWISGEFDYSAIKKFTHESESDYSSNFTKDGKIRVNLNCSSIAELDRLPGVGPATARRFLKYRLMHGPFINIEDIGNIKGIGTKTIEKMRDIAYIGEPEPIDTTLFTTQVSESVKNTSQISEIVNPPCGSGRININSASSTELETLPRVGPKTAARIISDRNENGPFTTISDLTRVKGIGKKTVERIKDLICAE